MRYTRDHLRKVCDCPRKRWGTCPHPWHFAFFWGRAYRFSLDKYLGRHLDGWDAARDAADRIRLAIKAGTFDPGTSARGLPAPHGMTFREFADEWQKARGDALVSGKIARYRLGTICSFSIPDANPPLTLGAKPLTQITTRDIEQFRDHRRRSVSTTAVNHDLRLLRAMFNWAIKRRLISESPFGRYRMPEITLGKDGQRHRRFETEKDEARVLAVAGPHLHSVIVAMIEAALRPGEVLSLQWRNAGRQELTITAEKSKTGKAREVPISGRLRAVLEMRRLDPAGRRLPDDAYVFGDEVGGKMSLGRTRAAWTAAAKVAGLDGFQLRDLRHEAASQLNEYASTSEVAMILGHSSVVTTNRYLMNPNKRALRRAVYRRDEARALKAAIMIEPEEGGEETTEKPC